jgi:ribosome-associated protein
MILHNNQSRAFSDSMPTPKLEMTSSRIDSLKITDSSLKLAMICAEAALDKKAEQVKILELARNSGIADYFVIVSALSTKQVQTIADTVARQSRAYGVRAHKLEGIDQAHWVLIDLGDVVVHVFLDAVRDHYDLESLWASAKRVQLPSVFFEPAATQA